MTDLHGRRGSVPVGVEKMLEGVRSRMREQGIEWSEEEFAELADAISHPAAMESIQQGMQREASCVQEGQEAPDFALKFLQEPEAPPLQLSSHFGRRPVALIFGSYT